MSNRSPEDWAAEHLEDVPLNESKPNGGAERDFEDRIGRPRANETPPVAELGEWDAGDIKTPPPRAWLLGNVFCRTFLSSLIAEGGTGKTAVRYAQLLSLAIGRSLTKEHVFQRCRVLIVSLEDNADEANRRVLAAMKHYGVTRDDVRGWLFVAAPGARAGKLMAIEEKGQAEIGELTFNLEAAIVRRKIDIVSLDPFIKTHAVNENDNNLIDQVAQVLLDLAAKHNIAIDSPHHVRKGPPSPGDADRGTRRKRSPRRRPPRL
jgi:RecA-family ATPase